MTRGTRLASVAAKASASKVLSKKRKAEEEEEEEEEDQEEEKVYDNQDESDIEDEEIETEFKIKDKKSTSGNKRQKKETKPAPPSSKSAKSAKSPVKPSTPTKSKVAPNDKQKLESITQSQSQSQSQQSSNKRSVTPHPSQQQQQQQQKKKEVKIKYNLKPFNIDRLAEYDKHMNDESLSNEKIIKRLKKLDEFLQDKKRGDIEGLELLLNILVEKKFLENKNFEIKLMASCCLSEIFRVYSPTIPFEASKVKEVFKLFIHMILSSDQVDKKLFPLYFQMLERLSVLRIFALLVMVDSDMVPKLFKDCISKVSGDQQHKPMDTMMLTILNTILESLEEMPNQLWNVLLEALIEHEKGGVPTAKALFTRDIIEINAHYLKVHFDLYLQDLLEPTVANDPSSSISTFVKKKKYEILTTMFKISPPFIYQALSSLEFDLEDNNVSVRKSVVKVLKSCYTESIESADELIQEKPTLYTTFLNRFHDVEEDIRLLMMEFAQEFETNSKLEVERIIKIVHERFRDNSPAVRIKAISVFQQFISSYPEFATPDLMSEFLERIKDKEVEVRKQALVSMANIWKSIRQSKGPLNDWDSNLFDSFSNIPNTIVQSFTLFDNDKFRAELTIDGVLLPQHTETKARSEVFLEIYSSLEENSKQILKKYFEEKKILRQEFMTFYNLIRHPKPSPPPAKSSSSSSSSNKQQQQAADEYEIEAQMTTVANLLPKFKNDHPKKLLRELMTKKKIFDTLSLACDIHTTPQKRYDIRVEISKANDDSSFSEFLKFLVNKLSFLIIGKENVKYYIRSLRNELNMDSFDKDKELDLLEEFSEKTYEKELKEPPVAIELLLMLSQIYPDIYDSYGDQLIEFLTCSKSIVFPTLQILSNSTKSIKFNQNSSKSMLALLLSLTEVQQPVLARLAFKTYIKFATPALTSTAANGKVDNNRLVVKLTDLTTKLFDELEDSKKNLLSILEVIGCIAKCYSSILISDSNHETTLQMLITKQILSGTCSLDFNVKVGLTKSENNSNHHSKDVVAKIAAIRCLSNYLLGIREIKKIHHDLVKEMFNLYEKVDTVKNYSDVEKGHLKLQIAIGLLKIFQKSSYEKEITPEQFILVCNSPSITLKTRNDSLIRKIIEKLAKYLRLNRLPMKYMCAMGMAAQQPNSVLSMVRKLSNSIIKTRRVIITRLAPYISNTKQLGEFYPESSMPYFLYVVSHREDFARENYIESAIYLNFYMDLLVEESDNYSIIHSTLLSIKSAGDALEPKSKNHIIAAELGLQILAHQYEQKRWKPQKHPVEIILPEKYYTISNNSNDDNDDVTVKLPSLLPKRFKLPPLPKPTANEIELKQQQDQQQQQQQPQQPQQKGEDENDTTSKEESGNTIDKPKVKGSKKVVAPKKPIAPKKKSSKKKKKEESSEEEESEESEESENESDQMEDDE